MRLAAVACGLFLGCSPQMSTVDAGTGGGASAGGGGAGGEAGGVAGGGAAGGAAGGVAGGAAGGSAGGSVVDSGSPDAGAPDAGPSLRTVPRPLTTTESFYPRLVTLTDGSLLASVVAPQASGHLGAIFFRSADQGLTFTERSRLDDPSFATGLCCATTFVLPRAIGALPAGALLWSASVGQGVQTAPMRIPVWKSTDQGVSWQPLGTALTGAVNRSAGGLWEPEFSQLDDGTLVVHVSDETDPAHSQKLIALRSSDGVSWGQQQNTVAPTSFGYRPGMATVRRRGPGAWLMGYEICGLPGDSCTAHLRTSSDGWSWGAATDLGLRPVTVDGRHLRHAPTISLAATPGANGRVYLVGQMVYDASGAVAPENGDLVLVNTEGGFNRWYAIPAPLPVANPYDNFCPNYSTVVAPSPDGTFAVSFASRWDGTTCRTYWARGPLLGTRDAAGVDAGVTYRLTNLISGLCLDAAATGNVQQWTCDGLPAQDWTFDAPAVRGGAGQCLTVAGGSSAPGANVEQQPCDGGSAQAWSVENVGRAAYVLRHAGTTGCLDVSAGSQAVGANVQQWTCNELAPQIWVLAPR